MELTSFYASCLQGVQQKLLQEQRNTATKVCKLQQQLTAAESKAAKAVQAASITQAGLLAQLTALKLSMEALACGRLTLEGALERAAQEEAVGNPGRLMVVEGEVLEKMEVLQQEKVQLQHQVDKAVLKAAKEAGQAAALEQELQHANQELAAAAAAAAKMGPTEIVMCIVIEGEGSSEALEAQVAALQKESLQLRTHLAASAAAGVGEEDGHDDTAADQVLQEVLQGVVEDVLQEQVAALQQEKLKLQRNLAAAHAKLAMVPQALPGARQDHAMAGEVLALQPENLQLQQRLLATQASFALPSAVTNPLFGTLSLDVHHDSFADLAQVAVLQHEKLQLQEELVHSQAQAAAEADKAEEVHARLQAQVAILKRGRMQLQQELAAAKGKQAAKEQQAAAVQEALLAESEAMQETYARAAQLQVSMEPIA